MKHKIILLAIAAFAALEVSAARPRLVVNIVVGSMRAEDLSRYADNYGEGGLRRLIDGGTVFADSRYDYQQTTTPVSLATLSTGAMPSTHGVIGSRWRDYVANEAVELIAGRNGAGPYNLIAPTLSEALLQHEPGSKAVTVAAEATSAIVLGGRGGEVFWLDSARCGWTTSPYYAADVPEWVARSNRERYNLSYIAPEWRTLYEKGRYVNSRNWDVILTGKNKKEKDETGSGRLKLTTDFDRMLYTPAGNTAVFGFAKQAIAQFKLGTDGTPDLLNICLDSSRRISEAYGPESVESEDMYYRLDRDLADFLTFVFAQVKNGEVLVVFTSDHGTSPSYDAGREEADRFNARQFEVIVNGFLNVRYGMGNWVLEYEDKCLYLNHNLIYERGLNLADVQNEVAIFAMQFRGVSHALSATAMRTSYFGSGYARKMQNSFYPRRSGDVIMNLMPGWIEENDRCASSSGAAGILRLRSRSPAREAPRGHDGRGADRGAGAGDHRTCGVGGRSAPGNHRFLRIKKYTDMDKIQEEIIEEFSVFDDWLDKYDYLIGLSDSLPAIPAEHRTVQYLIEGCQSRVWVDARMEQGRVYYAADSDAIITKGIIALLIRVLNGRTPQEILDTELYFIDAIGLSANLSPTRSNGLLSMVKQMRLYALAFASKDGANEK